MSFISFSCPLLHSAGALMKLTGKPLAEMPMEMALEATCWRTWEVHLETSWVAKGTCLPGWAPPKSAED